MSASTRRSGSGTPRARCPNATKSLPPRPFQSSSFPPHALGRRRLGPGLEQCHDAPANVVRRIQRVSVGAADDLPFRSRDPDVHGGCRRDAGVVDDSDPWIAGARRDRHASVAGSSVQHQDLEDVRVVLSDQRGQAVAEVLPFVQYRQEYRDGWKITGNAY